MADGSQQPVYGYDGGGPPPNPYGYGGGWDSRYPQPQGQYQGGGGYGGGGGYADQGEPPWGYPPEEPQYPAFDGTPNYGSDYGDSYPAYGGTSSDYAYQDDNYPPPSDGADWGSDFVDDTLTDAYSSPDDLAYQDLDSQYGGGLGNG
jgi:hypothetical protein